MKLKILVIAGFSTMALFSCEKEDENVPTNTKLLIEKSWVILQQEENNNGIGFVDIFSKKPACEKDNIITFKSTFKVEESEGASACASNTVNQIISNQTWAFSNNEKSLVIDGATATIEKLDANTLILVVEEGTTATTKVVTRTTLGH